MNDGFEDLSLDLGPPQGEGATREASGKDPRKSGISVKNAPENGGAAASRGGGPVVTSPVPIPEARISFSVPVTHPQHPLFGRARAEEKPGFSCAEKDRGCVEFLEQISSRPEEYAGYSVCVSRKGPLQFDGEDLPRGPLWSGSPASFRELREYVLDRYGGGDFSLEVRNAEGKLMHSMNFSWGTQHHRPRVAVEGRPFVTRPCGLQYWEQERRERDEPMADFGGYEFGSGRNARALGSSLGGTGADNSLQAIRKNIEEIRALDSLEETKTELEANRKRRAKRGEDGDGKREVEQLREEFRRAQEESRKELKDFLQGLKDILLAQAQNGKEGREGNPLLIEVMKSQGNMMQAAMTALAAAGGSRAGGTEEFFKAQAASQGEVFRTMLEISRDAAAKADRLAERVIGKQLDFGNDRLQTWKDSIDFFLKLQERMGGGGDDDWNPEAGILGNLGGLLFKGLKGLIRGGGGGLGGALAQAGVGGPEGAQSEPVFGAPRALPAMVSRSALPSVREVPKELEQFSVQAVEAPPQARVVPGPGSGPARTGGLSPVQVVPFQAPGSSEAPLGPVYEEIYVDGGSGQGLSEGENPVDGMMRQAIREMRERVSGYGWAEKFFEVLPSDLAKNLAGSGSTPESLKLLFLKCDPRLYREFTAFLQTGEREYALDYMSNGIKRLQEFLRKKQEV